MQFKKEASLLVAAIALFAVATFLYTYQAATEAATLMYQNITYPYRAIAICFVGVGFVSMVAASISYSRKTKNLAAQPV
jgi:hypothetical protein